MASFAPHKSRTLEPLRSGLVRGIPKGTFRVLSYNRNFSNARIQTLTRRRFGSGVSSSLSVAAATANSRGCGSGNCLLSGPLLPPPWARGFASRNRRRAEAYWESEHLAHDIQEETQKVEDAEREYADLMGNGLRRAT